MNFLRLEKTTKSQVCKGLQLLIGRVAKENSYISGICKPTPVTSDGIHFHLHRHYIFFSYSGRCHVFWSYTYFYREQFVYFVPMHVSVVSVF